MLRRLFILVILKVCFAYKILVVFPIPGSSHAILGEGYVRHLLEAGHEVTYITPLPRLRPSPNLRQIDVSANFEVSPLGEVIHIEKLMRKEIDMTNLYVVKDMMIAFANATIRNPNVKRLMDNPDERFDAVIVEWLFTEIYSGFSSVFQCPLIWSSSMEPHTLVLWLIDEAPSPAYVPDIISSIKLPFDFWKRVKNLWIFMERILLNWSALSKESSIYDAGFGPSAIKRGVKLSPLAEVMYNGSLMLGNSHVSLGQPIKLPANYKSILGYHIPQKIDPLPESIQRVMDNARNGVIYFSMGSMLNSTTFPSKLKKGLLEMFGGLKQTVLWKFEEAVPDLPKNIHIVQWAPQQSILAHPNCVLFITHGGLLSLTEAVHFKKLVIGVPMFADQFLNMDRVVGKGFGKRVDLDWDFVDNLRVAIAEIIDNPRYCDAAEEISFVYHHRPVSPGSELVHWVQHVARTQGAPHLRSSALHVPLYQKMYLDLAAVVLIIIIVITKLIKTLFRKKSTEKNHKKNLKK
ncbi:unnamed protein product [Diatraea saccharalis]|uniref:Glucuronosyltransferase n=1 Tax=Diatraea saccharalis TaxID=40085 RepID=A0A9N9RA00_9NEOP|nr:unnamed protein product [Diatraea saccharalis]